MDAEKLNGRFAMMGVMGTTAFELLAGRNAAALTDYLPLDLITLTAVTGLYP